MQYEPSYYIGKYRRPILIAVILIVICSVGFTIWHNIRLAAERRGKLPVPVYVVPRDATVMLSNGQQLTTRGTAYIAPGNYKVTVASDGFDTQTRDVRVTSDAVPYIYIGLAGRSTQAKSWQQAHQSDYQQLEILTVERNREYNTLFKSRNQIVNILPIKDPYYSIDYRNYDDRSIELVVWGTSPQTRRAALDLLRKKGYEPTDYRISYDGFENPLEATP